MQINTVNPYVSTSSMRDLPNMSKQEKMEKTAAEFEEFFVYQMLQETQPEVDLDNDFMGGAVEQTFRPILNEHIAKEIVEAGGVGLKENILNQMKKYEEADRYGR
tara:strand:- start:576 stop:890 length:315 start_codon:yes stop_codon:yes gene_type:complete